jgi:glycosyltransferase involved in cell wall biosynthesis
MDNSASHFPKGDICKRVFLPDSPLVSIITVCLNSDKYLAQTIQSVINQTYGNIEYIIIDGGSTDKTLNIIQEYEKYIARWVSEPDEGIYDAMNKGISFAGGEWVGIINSDDWYEPDTVYNVIKAAAEKPEAGVFFGDMFLHQQENDQSIYHKVKDWIDNPLLNTTPHPGCFVSRRIYEQFRFNPNFRIVGDQDLMVRLYFSGIKFSHIDRILANFRLGGVGSQLSYRSIIERYRIRSRYHRLEALLWWFSTTFLFLLKRLYKCFPEAFKKKYRTCRQKFIAD